MFRSNYMRYSSHIFLALFALSATLAPAAASAQIASTADRIDAIERQIQNLQSELKSLKKELGDAKQELRQSRGETQRARDQASQASQAAARAQADAQRAVAAETQAKQAAAQAQAAAGAPQPGTEGVKFTMPAGRPTLSGMNGRASLTIGGQVQFDMGGYFQNPGPFTQFPDLNNGVNLRRGRLFFVGKFDDFSVNITPDFGGSPDGSPTLYEANFNYTGIKPVTATVGYFKPWFSLYDLQSSNDFLLLERPSIVEIARNLAAGDARASVGGKASTDNYFAAAYFTGTTYGAQQGGLLNGEQTGGVLRLAGRPYHDSDWSLHTGFSGELVFHPNVNASGTPGVSRTTLTLQDRPELRIDMNRLISTGSLSASGANAYGGEIGIGWRNFLVQGEYYGINVNQTKLPGVPAPGLSFNGGYVEGGWVITGEPIPYNASAAAFARPKVANPFSFGEGGWGAWEVSARYSTTSLNSNVTTGVSQSATGGVFGGQQQILGLGFSWYPNDWLRFLLQFQYVDVNRLNSAGINQTGQRYELVAGRIQAAW